MAQQLSTNTFGVARWIVSPTLSNGTHTTIAGAMASASSGDTIWVRDGTYTENITLKAGVVVTASPSDQSNPNVTVVGKWTMTVAGNCAIENIRLETNNDYAVEVTGSAASVVRLRNCRVIGTNFSCLHLTSSDAGSAIFLNFCGGDTQTTGIAFFVVTGIGNIGITKCVQIDNTGGSTTASTMSAGSLNAQYSVMKIPISTSGAASLSFLYCYLYTIEINQTALTTTGTGSATVQYSQYVSGTASAVSIGVGTAVTLIDCAVNSSNTNAVTGAGTLSYGPIEFTGSSSTVNVTTQTPLSIGPRIKFGNGVAGAGGSQIMSGTGSPDTAVTATQGSLFLRVDGTSPYMNTNGATAWSPVAVQTTGTWTPTVTGQTTAGTTTYSTQTGNYVRVGNVVTLTCTIVYSAATGTGNLTIGGLPFTVGTGFPTGAVYFDSAGTVWPIGRTNICVTAANASTAATISCSGTGVAVSIMQMANTATSIIFGLTYII